VSFKLETEKGKEKAEAVFDVAEGKGVAFTQKVTPKGKIKSVTTTTFTYEPYEFTSKDYPMNPGTKLIYYAEKQGLDTTKPPFAVAFDLNGPWDFSTGPTEGEVDYVYVAPKDTEQTVDFPQATTARTQETSVSKVNFFYQKSSESLQILGYASKTLLSAIALTSKYNPPFPAYKFPFKAGDSWSTAYTVTMSGLGTGTDRSEDVNRVVSRNAIKVPQGSYDKCYLVQDRNHYVSSGGTITDQIDYTWLVPGVGAVAYLYSVNGETNEVFTQASSFMRLKYFGTSKPGI
jgi:hypothetical protein